MPADPALILDGLRTPIGLLNGALAAVPATRLGSVAIRALLGRHRLDGARIDEVLMGNVVSAGLGQNPARQAALGAGLPPSVGAATINKVCGSGLKAVMLADQAIRLGEAHLVVAGGLESMSGAPHLLPGARAGFRLGPAELLDATLRDGLQDAYSGLSMGLYGDRLTQRYGLSREEQDDYAVRSHTRARAANESGAFADEITPVEVTVKGKTSLVAHDEGPARFDEAKLRALKPAFSPDGTITAGNASGINDGAAALLIASREAAESLGLAPRARIVAAATASREPEWFTIAPIDAIRKLIDRTGWAIDEVDAWEINEAFAAVALAAERELRLPPERVNVLGGSVALGHPIGCSGARVLVTLLTALRLRGGRRGVACLCVGGGEAVAMAVEAVG